VENAITETAATTARLITAEAILMYLHVLERMLIAQ
jgi:hypothetical protein